MKLKYSEIPGGFKEKVCPRCAHYEKGQAPCDTCYMDGQYTEFTSRSKKSAFRIINACKEAGKKCTPNCQVVNGCKIYFRRGVSSPGSKKPQVSTPKR